MRAWGRPSRMAGWRSWPLEAIRPLADLASDAMDTISNFNDYVDVLRERLFDYEALHATTGMPNFQTDVMVDIDAPAGWPPQAYDELDAQGHLSPASTKSLNGAAYGLLSADGRFYVREQRESA